MTKHQYSKMGGPPFPKRRKSTTFEQLKREKGRSRNACDRCKQKKVKCDGEGLRTCTICQEGDFHCHYAQRALSEKNQYRKGYVEMVEEANEYYKTGIHKLYELFNDAPIFSDLRHKYRDGGNPTAQEIARATGIASTDRPHEGGIEKINWYLASQNKPLLVRTGEWDKIQATAPAHPPSPSSTMVSSPAVSPKMRASSPEQVSTADSSAFPTHAPNSPFGNSLPSPVSSRAHSFTSPSPAQFRQEQSLQDAVRHMSASRTTTSLSHHASNGHQRPAPVASIQPQLALSTSNQPQAYPSPPSQSPVSAQTYAAVTESNMNVSSQTLCLADLDLNRPSTQAYNPTLSSGPMDLDSQFLGMEAFNPLSLAGGDVDAAWASLHPNQPFTPGMQEMRMQSMGLKM